MISEEMMQGLLLSLLGWYHSESDVQKVVCRLAQLGYTQYVEMACIGPVPNDEVDREISTSIYYPDTAPPFPGVMLLSGSSPAHSDSMRERKDLFVENGFAVMILDSFTRARILEDCFRGDTPCSAHQRLTKSHHNDTMTGFFECPTISYQGGGEEMSFLLKTYLDRISSGYILSPAERAHDLYHALHVFRQDEQVDANNLVLVGYSHGASAVLESLTFTGNEVSPPGDESFSAGEHSLDGVVASVVYYPNCRPGSYFEWHSNIKNIDLLVHLADRDEYVKPELCQGVIDKIKTSRSDQKLQVHRYDDLHAFDMREYGAAFNEKNQKLSFDRTLKFIREAVDPKYQ